MALASAALVLLAGVAWGVMRQREVPDAGQRRVLVVLPLENLTGDSAQDYFAEGLTEEIITELSRLDHGQLGVIARTTAMRYSGSGKSAAEILAYFEWDFEGADRESRRALELDPSYPTAHHWYGIYLFSLKTVPSVDLKPAAAWQQS